MGSVYSKSPSVVTSLSSVSSFGKTGSFLEYERIIHHLNSGDLIEVLRGPYKHWAIFESVDRFGNCMCFHITAIEEPIDHNDSGLEKNDVRKEISFDGKALLKYEPLLDILKDSDSPKPSMCRINNQEIMGQRMRKMINNQIPDLNQVFKVLHAFKDTVLKYCLKSLNCEHYCTFWKYGIGWSSQVNSFKDIITTALKTVSSLSRTAADVLQHNGCYKLGIVCLLVSVISAEAARVVEAIDFTLKDLRIEDVVRHAIAY
ncbi:unnamed protein product [Medioppia subpectinata]|uniref:LRAT domain-containing protein n=1 Tax=Medioppia subpectinata TaxID=1979941 RepID=A0A7R9LAZ5_9ACAR|nr:unnamed protein product [Medioppia subpectinata]CAG2117378.1 unnamed protein product [Medioppia subpectinata]